MPTSNIIGYLWSNRQDLDIDGLPDLLQVISDLQRCGLDAVRVEELKVFGAPVGTSVQLVERTAEEWSSLVEEALVQSAIEHTIDMLHEERDSR